MAGKFNQAHAAALWNLIGVTVSGTRIVPKEHKGNVTFIGYADIQVWLYGQEETIPFLILCGNSIKLINGEIHFDPKSERGKGSRNKDFFPHWLPAEAASRKVITKKLEEDATIQEMVALAQAKLAESVIATQ